MTTNEHTDTNSQPGEVRSSDGLCLLPLSPRDHPEPQVMTWSALEMQAIRRYASACVAAERERHRALAIAATAAMEDLQQASAFLSRKSRDRAPATLQVLRAALAVLKA